VTGAVAQALSQYTDLLTRVDHLFGEIRSRHSGAIKCALGCHSCCKPALTVGPLEAAAIREGLAGDHSRAAELRALEATNPHRGKRCSFLRADGGCGIYELRPLVCRSHGVPLQFKDPDAGGREEAARLRDVCGLNFVGEDIGRLPAADVMNLDTLNTLLALLTQRAFGKKMERVELKVSAILGS
jgi:Fe-S-cluster containining protein